MQTPFHTENAHNFGLQLARLADLPQVEFDTDYFGGELALLRKPGAWQQRSLTEKAFGKLYDKNLFTVAFSHHSISGSSLIGMASQIQKEKGELSVNVILISSPETDLYFEHSSNGTVTLYALSGGLVDARGTLYHGKFPHPVKVGIFDDSRLRTVQKSRGSFIRSLPLLNHPEHSEEFIRKSSQKSLLFDIAQRSGIYIPHHEFLPPSSFGKSGMYIASRRLLEKFITTFCNNGYVVKPNRGSQGSGISILFDQKFPNESIIKKALCNEGIIVEERMSSVPLVHSGKIYDWNLRVLGTPKGVLDIEVRYSELGGPVNISIEAAAREFTTKFLKELTPQPDDPGKLYKHILASLDQFCKEFCSRFESGFIGVDIIISDITQCKEPLESNLPLIDGRYLISCNEVNVGCVGGLSTLTRIRRTPERKIRALKNFILELSTSNPDPGNVHPQGELVQASKALTPSKVILHSLKNDISVLNDYTLKETLIGLMTCLNEEDISIDFSTVKALAYELKKRQMFDQGILLAEYFMKHEMRRNFHLIFSLILRHTLGSSLEDIKKDAQRFAAIPPSNMYAVDEVIAFFSTLSPEIAYEYIRTVDQRIIAPDLKMSNLLRYSYSIKHWALFFKSIDDSSFCIELISQAAKMMGDIYQQLNSKAGQFEIIQHTMFYMAISEFLGAAVKFSSESHDLEAKRTILEFANTFFTTPLFLKLTVSRQKKEIVMALFALYLELGLVEDALNLKNRCSISIHEWEQDRDLFEKNFRLQHVRAFFTPQSPGMLKRFKLTKETPTLPLSQEHRTWRDTYYRDSEAYKIHNELRQLFEL